MKMNSIKLILRCFLRGLFTLLVMALASCYYGGEAPHYGIEPSSGAMVPPKQIALLLPLQGSMSGPGRAVRDGFMAAYYQYQTVQGEGNIKVQVYDTAQGSIESVYEKAVSDGADCIVGPLEKDKAQQLAKGPAPVTTILLNYTDGSADAANMYQFGLSPLDEALQAAQKAHADDRHSALIIAPAGSWGAGVVNAFRKEWQALGGRVVGEYDYASDQDLSAYIRQLLRVNDSEAYQKNMEQVLGRKLKPEEFRRQDGDMIFLVAFPEKARQINPLLKFYYAGDLPVYSISLVYSGIPSAFKDQDLNGIRFDDMPWMLNPKSSHLSAYPRLYALGMDAFALTMTRHQLTHYSESGIKGHTGTLYLSSDRRISRKLIWLQFSQGLVYSYRGNDVM